MTGIEAGKAYVKFLLDDKDLKKSLTKVGDKLQSIGKIGTAATAPIVGAFAACTKAFVDAGSKLTDLSERTGISAESLSSLSYVAEQSGTNLDTLANGVLKMEKNIGNSIAGLGTFGDTLGQLGVDLEELKALNPEQQFLRLSTAIAGVEDPTMRAALAQKVFGGAGKELLPLLSQGAEGMAIMRDEAGRLGLVMSNEAVAAADKLGDTYGVLKGQVMALAVAIGGALAGDQQKFLEATQETVAAVIAWVKANPELVRTVALVAGAVALASVAVVGLGAVMTALVAHPVLAFLAACVVAYIVLDRIVKKINDKLGTQLETLSLLAPGFATLVDAAQWALSSTSEEGDVPFDIEGEAKNAAAQLKADAAGLQQQVMAGATVPDASSALAGDAAGVAQMANSHAAKTSEGIWKLVEIANETLAWHKNNGGLNFN